MQRLFLVLFIASELSYYLLIAQTGIVQYFGSNIYLIALLPIGGIIGSLSVGYIKISNRNKILFFLLVQLVLSFYYPDLSQLMLFILGISIGSLAPLVINELKKATLTDLGFALGLSYVLGTFLVTYEVSQRGELAILLTMIALVSSNFIGQKEFGKSTYNYEEYSLLTMVLWIFLDSALFETLARDANISIWGGEYIYQIAIFHLIGIIVAIKVKIEKKQKELFIIVLFALSYLLYFLRECYLLAIIYPFVISYYNVMILKTILKKDLKTLGIFMVFIGWIASGAGLFFALESLMLFIPIIFLIIFFGIINIQEIQKKEIRYV